MKKKFFFIIISSIAVLFVSLSYARFLYSDSIARIQNTLLELSDQSVQVLTNETNKGIKTLINLSAYIGEEEELHIPTIIHRLSSVDSINDFKRMGIILPDGTAYTTDNYLLHLEDRNYFHQSMKGYTCISEPLIDKSDQAAIIVYSTPIYHKKTIKAVLYAAYYSEKYENTLATSTFNGNGYTYVINSKGDYIANTNPKKNTIKSSNFFDYLETNNTKNSVSLQQLQSAISNSESGFVKLYTDNKNYVYYQPVHINDWYLLTIVPTSVVQEEANSTLLFTYLFTIFCVIIFIFLTLRMTRLELISKKELLNIAFVDKITGGATLEKFCIDAKTILKKPANDCYAIVLFNIEKFKYINSLYGHEQGDRTLSFIWNCINNYLEKKELVCRETADNFLLLIHAYNKNFILQRILEIPKHINQTCSFAKHPYEFKFYIGIYSIEDVSLEISTMIDYATTALSYAKRHPLLSYSLYDNKIQQELIQTKSIENHFSSSLQNKEFIVYYQPKYNIEKKCYDGAEALVRWQTKNNKLIPPNVFIPIFENNGSIVELDRYIFQEVCIHIREWLDKGYPVTPISVNVSKLHLYRKDFISTYLCIMENYQIPAQLIQLELTETVMFDNESILIHVIEELHTHNLLVLMDDFGSGYSSIGLLKNIPLDVLKIDKSLIDDSEKNENGQKIIKSIISLSKELHMKVTAEGVETKEQYNFLASLHCDYIQGFYCAKPMPKLQYEQIIENPYEVF